MTSEIAGTRLPVNSIYSPITNESIGSHGGILAMGDLHLGPTRDPHNLRIIRGIHEQLDRDPSIEVVVFAGDTFDIKKYQKSSGIEGILNTWGEDFYELGQKVPVVGVLGDHDELEEFMKSGVPNIKAWCHRAIIARDSSPTVVIEHRPLRIADGKVYWQSGSRLDEWLPKYEIFSKACDWAEYQIARAMGQKGLDWLAKGYLLEDVIRARVEFPDKLVVRAHCHAVYQLIRADGTGYINTGTSKHELPRNVANINGKVYVGPLMS